jgi:MFS family permease
VSLDVTKSGSFARLVWSNLAAQAAEQIGLAAALLVAVLVFSAGPGAVGALQAAQTLPFLLVAIPLGVLADRVSRPRLMAAAETLRVVSFALVLVLLATGLLTLPLLALLGFIGACGTVAYSVSAPALVPSVVRATALSAANARIEVARTSALAIGPALGGMLVEWFGCGRRRHRAGGRARGRIDHGVHDLGAVRSARRIELLPPRSGADPLGGEHHHLAPDRHSG